LVSRLSPYLACGRSRTRGSRATGDDPLLQDESWKLQRARDQTGTRFERQFYVLEDKLKVDLSDRVGLNNDFFYFRTRWNRHCSSVLKKVLHILENQGGNRKEAIRELQPLVAAHKVRAKSWYFSILTNKKHDRFVMFFLSFFNQFLHFPHINMGKMAKDYGKLHAYFCQHLCYIYLTINNPFLHQEI
jgi:hypothetical protein